MKYLSILILGIFFSINSFAQEANTSKKAIESTFTVKGVCGMCENRIEEAAMRVSGVKLADWDKHSQELTVVYKSNKTTEEQIHKAVAAKGHETAKVKADSAAYQRLPHCCMYNDGSKVPH